MLIGLGLLKKILRDNSMEMLLRIDRQMLVDDEIQAYKRIMDYVTRYKALPPESFIEIDADSAYTYDYYFDTLKKRHIENQLQNLAHMIQSNVRHEKVLGYMQNLLTSINPVDTVDDYVTVMKNMIERNRSLYLSFGRVGYSTGWKTLDDAISGYQRGDINVIAGRPKKGKTTLLIYSANASINQNLKTLFFSLEMTKEQILTRLAGIRSRVSPSIIRKGEITDYVEARLLESLSVMDNFYLVEGNLSFSGLVSNILKVSPDIVYIDGAYLIDMNVRHNMPFHEKAKYTIESLKRLAMGYDIPIVCTYQLNRQGNRTDNLDLTQLAFSDAIGQTASSVLAVVDTEIPTQKKVSIIATRDGVSEDFFINWNWEYSDFSEVE